jgi:hypothetical protein
MMTQNSDADRVQRLKAAIMDTSKALKHSIDDVEALRKEKKEIPPPRNKDEARRR